MFKSRIKTIRFQLVLYENIMTYILKQFKLYRHHCFELVMVIRILLVMAINILIMVVSSIVVIKDFKLKAQLILDILVMGFRFSTMVLVVGCRLVSYQNSS